MPVLDRRGVEELLARALLVDRAKYHGSDHTLDYCRTCDEFYWLDTDDGEHDGHRKTIVPFVEVR